MISKDFFVLNYGSFHSTEIYDVEKIYNVIDAIAIKTNYIHLP